MTSFQAVIHKANGHTGTSSSEWAYGIEWALCENRMQSLFGWLWYFSDTSCLLEKNTSNVRGLKCPWLHENAYPWEMGHLRITTALINTCQNQIPLRSDTQEKTCRTGIGTKRGYWNGVGGEQFENSLLPQHVISQTWAASVGKTD